ncbi:MAG: acetolactate synthase [Planctomycetes bacterium]|nr:acetolactate synthase [Planctomycetota bacterium]
MHEITEDQASPRIRQLSIFLENRLGALLGVTRVLEAQTINICAVSITDAADHAVVRVVVDRPSLAAASLQAEGYHLMESDLLGVSLPASKVGGFRKVLTALARAELNVHYVYAVATHNPIGAVLALHVEDMDRAARVLVESGMELVSQDDLR